MNNNYGKVVNSEKKVIYYSEHSQKEIHKAAKILKSKNLLNFDSVRIKLNFN